MAKPVRFLMSLALCGLLLAPGVLFLTQCASSSRMEVEVPSLKIRRDYLRAHPRSPFAKNIRQGKPAIGMNYEELRATVASRDFDSTFRVETPDTFMVHMYNAARCQTGLLGRSTCDYFFITDKFYFQGGRVSSMVSDTSDWRAVPDVRDNLLP